MQKLKFYYTYYLCNAIKNILDMQFGYTRNLNDFYGDGKIWGLIQTFPKYSLFHQFIEFVVANIYYEKMESNFEKWIEVKQKYINNIDNDIKIEKFPIEYAFDFYSIKYKSVKEYSLLINKPLTNFDEFDFDDYYSQNIIEPLDYLIEQTTQEVFYILFQNRSLMLKFNQMIADVLEYEKDDGIPEDLAILIRDNGCLKRKNIPKWVKRAVFFRDKGRCVLCHKDLTNLINTENKENYDHIVPLAQHGFNDVSNIQLLCKECNQVDKKAKSAQTSDKYHSWY